MDLYNFIYDLLVWLITGINDSILDPLMDLLSSLLDWLMKMADGLLAFIGLNLDLAGRFRAVIEFVRNIPDLLLSHLILDLLTLVIIIVVFLMVVMTQVIVFIYWERKLFARISDRHGPKLVGFLNHGFLQQIADALKLFLKEIITPSKTDRFLFHIAPVILVSSTLVILSALPLSEGFYVSRPSGGILFLMAMFSIAPIAILVGGWGSNNKYSLIGGMRSAAMMMSYEIPLLLSIGAVILLAGSFDTFDIVSAQSRLGIWFGAPLFLGLVIFMITIVAEVERIPFDLPEAEAELVEGWTTEYGGMRLGLIWLTEYIRMYCGAAICAILFLGGWNGPEIPLPILSSLSGEIWITLKIYVIIIIFIWIRFSLPRVRTDQILHFGWRRLLPLAMINLFIALAFKILADHWGWL